MPLARCVVPPGRFASGRWDGRRGAAVGRELNNADEEGDGRNVISVRVSSIIYYESKNGSGPRRGGGWASGNKGGPLKA